MATLDQPSGTKGGEPSAPDVLGMAGRLARRPTRAQMTEADLGAAPVLCTRLQAFETKKKLAHDLSVLTAWSHFF
jgi:hypothetical protein